MTPENLIAVPLALFALYGLGLPLAWLAPAPEHSPWVQRVAVAPLFAIAVVAVAATVLRVLSVDLHPWQYVLGALAAWTAALLARRREWSVQRPASDVFVPGVLVGLLALQWFLSLIGYGLYLPSRDFKNHSIWVAQVAYTQSADPGLVLRESPLAAPVEGSVYPIGLHTALGWVLPTTDWSSIGVTAAAAVVTTTISLPMGLLALARCWRPGATGFHMLVGLCAVALPGLTWPFVYGSVTLLAATALMPAAMGALWYWTRAQDWPSLAALAVALGGLFTLHVSEALGLAMIAVVVAPRRTWAWAIRHWGLVLAAGLVGLASIFLSGYAEALGATLAGGTWDYGSTTLNPLVGFITPFVILIKSTSLLALVWAVLCGLGVALAVRERLASFPLRALLVVMGLSLLATTAGVPAWLKAPTVAWYGQPERIALMAAGPIALYACLALDRGIQSAARVLARPPVPSSLVTGLALGAVVGLLAITSGSPVSDRRQNLEAALAGAGDTASVAAELRDRLGTGQTVLGFEGDGTQFLFAYNRTPVIVDAELGRELGRISAPGVAESMEELGIAFVAFGTTSLHWGPKVGFSVPALLQQPQFTEELRGSDMVILRYTGAP